MKLQTLRREYENLKMKDSEKMNDYFSRVMEIVNQIRIYGDSISDEKIVQKVLISLPSKYDASIAAIEESKDLSTLSLVELMGSLESHEQRLLRHEANPIESAFQTKLSMGMQNPSEKTQVGPEKRQYNNKKGGRFVKGNSQNQNKGRGKDVTCDFCKKIWTC